MAERRSGISRSLRPRLIKKYRDEHYKWIKALRNSERRTVTLGTTITKKDLVDAALEAITILEIDLIRRKFYSKSGKSRKDLNEELGIYQSYAGPEQLWIYLNYFSP